LTVNHKNAVAEEADIAANREKVEAAVAGAAAGTPEVDLLAAIDLAARALPAGGAHTLVVVDSGLSTTGPLDFTQPGVLDADAAQLADGLAAAGALPDLTDVDVIFQGLGDTALPQQAISRAQQTNVRSIWQAVVRAAGGDAELVDAPLSGDARPGLPWVTPVQPGSGPVCVVETVVLTEGDVAFQPDSAEFVDPAAVAATLKPIAERMSAAELTGKITGMTARVGDDLGQQQLSEDRARAVRDELVDRGVAAEVLTVEGVGSHFAGYDDADPAANRKVAIDLAAPSADVTCAAAG
jgi:outer membrane protein OmpA-like peptidoglycan-associated protein